MKTPQPHHLFFGICSLVSSVYIAKTIQLLTGMTIAPFFGFSLGTSILLYALYVSSKLVERASLRKVQLKHIALIIHLDDLPAFYALVGWLLAEGYTLEEIERLLVWFIVSATTTD